MTSEIWAALIGAVGGVIATMIPYVVTRIRLSKDRFATDMESKGIKWEGEELVDIRQLRILRALAGEDCGRGLYTYKNNDFYRPALEQLEKIGWVKSIEGKYHLTSKSLPYTYRYLRWLHSLWKPGGGSRI